MRLNTSTVEVIGTKSERRQTPTFMSLKLGAGGAIPRAMQGVPAHTSHLTVRVLSRSPARRWHAVHANGWLPTRTDDRDTSYLVRKNIQGRELPSKATRKRDSRENSRMHCFAQREPNATWRLSHGLPEI